MACSWPARLCVRKRSSRWPAAASSAPPAVPLPRSVPDPGNPAPPLPPVGLHPARAAPCFFLPAALAALADLQSAPKRRLAVVAPKQIQAFFPIAKSRALPPSLPSESAPDTIDAFSCFRSFPLLLLQRPPESVRLGSGLDDVGLVRQPVQHRLA